MMTRFLSFRALRTTLPLKLTLLGSLGLISGCGGSGEFFDEFSPKPAVVSDFQGQTFAFSWLPNGNPLDTDLGPMSLAFSTFSGNSGTFTLTETDGGSATGSATWSAPTMTFTVNATTGSIGVAPGQTLTTRIEAEDSDSRIRLTNPTTGTNAASDL